MCGIAGIISPDKRADTLKAEANAMIETLRHRGPDSCGIWSDASNGLALAHRRLSIQDLSENGKQPMFSRTHRYYVVYNGEIYNFKEIAAELLNYGCQFTGRSDTEVLLSAIEQWGIEKSVKKLIGMFAFALWDKKKRTLFLCRDRLGEKPLYYGWLGTTFYFASELKAIEKVAPARSLEINTAGLTDYFRYGYIPAPHSIYQDIHKLPPGTILSLTKTCHAQKAQFSPWADSSIGSPKSYWSVIDAATQGLSTIIHDKDTAVEELDKLLHVTVRRQMIADVKVGMFLSGGIDSTLVSAIAQNESSKRIRTFTIGFDENEYDESAYAEKIAKHLGTEHLTVRVTEKDSMDVIPDLASIYDEPFADSSQIPTYLVSKIARQHVTVCLSGDGGDELFCGYNRYSSLDHIWKKVDSVPFPIRKLYGQILSIPTTGFWDRLYNAYTVISAGKHEKQKLVGLKLQKLAGLLQQQSLMSGYEYLLSYWHHPENLVELGNGNDTTSPDISLPRSAGFLETVMYLDQVGYLPGDNLAKVDRASMAVSLETRLPLLSHELLELSWRIPVSMKVRRNTSKWILRQLLYKYVPRKLIDRPKMGFSVPIANWLRGELKEWAESLLCSIKTSGDGFIKEEPVFVKWNEHLSGRRDHSHQLWTVLMFLSWMNNHK